MREDPPQFLVHLPLRFGDAPRDDGKSSTMENASAAALDGEIFALILLRKVEAGLIDRVPLMDHLDRKWRRSGKRESPQLMRDFLFAGAAARFADRVIKSTKARSLG